MNRISIYVLALGAFVLGTADFVVAGILDMIANDLNVSVGLAGQLVTTYSLSFVIGSLVLVAITARFERKKILLISLAIFFVGNIIAFMSYHFELLMISRVVLAMSGGLYTVLASNFAAKLATPEKKGTAIATVITGFSLSLVLGVPIGTFSTAYMDWRYIFLIIAVITLLMIMGMIKLIPTVKGENPVSVKEQVLVLKDKRVVSGLFTTLLWILGYSIVFIYISPLLRTTTGFSIELISTALLLLGISAFTGSRFGGYAVDKWGVELTIKISLFIHAASLIVLPITATSTWGAMLTIMIWGAATWTTTPAIQFYLISLRPQSSEILLSYNTAVLNLGITLGASFGGVMIQYTSVRHLGWISGLVVFVALVTASYSFLLHGKKTQATL